MMILKTIELTYLTLWATHFSLAVVVAIVSYYIGHRAGAYDQHKDWTKWYKRQLNREHSAKRSQSRPIDQAEPTQETE